MHMLLEVFLDVLKDTCCPFTLLLPLSSSTHHLASPVLLWRLLRTQSLLEQKLADADVSEEDQNNLLKFLEKKEIVYIRLQRHKLGVADFDLLTMIGKGAFGELKKAEMLRRGQVEHVRSERNLLAEVDNNYFKGWSWFASS
ncbi:hypothetical protein Rs2_22707 [Raphanus sativus]|nr:hypothetical protein Rs2_22707 [Raphanus sativus]